MTTLDHQIGFKAESTWGTPVTVDRFAEFNSESIEHQPMRTESNGLRTGRNVKRADRFTNWFGGAAGGVQLDVMSAGFGFWLEQMLGTVATTGPAETAAYTHTGTIGDLTGTSFTFQIGKPLYPGGTVQPLTYAGGKVAEWTLSNTVDANLVADLNMDFKAVATGTSLAAASYPTAIPLAWTGGTVTVGGTTVDVTDISIHGTNGLAAERRFLGVLKKEQIAGLRELDFEFVCDFEDMTQYDRVHSDTRSGALAEIVATWTATESISGTSTPLYPSLTVTLSAARFDSFSAPVNGTEGISQTIGGAVTDNGSDEPVTIAYVSADATP